MGTRGVVWSAALAAALFRFPGFFWPLRADEAGYLLVARNWAPQPDSTFGPFWVDRSPVLIALVKLSDSIGGAFFLRFVAALGVVLLVLAAAGCARVVTRDERVVAWTAVAAAATVGSAMIDAVGAKGEILGIPFVVTSFWLALLALDRERVDGRAVLLAGGAGLTAMLALGLKQNMASGLLFGGVLLVASLVAKRITVAEFARLALGAAAGAAVPVGAVVLWATSAGVHLHTIWYAVYGFRSDAFGVITAQEASAPFVRALMLGLILLGTGLIGFSAWFVIRLREVWKVDAVVATAALSLLLFDGMSLVLGGSFWRAYLFTLVPGTIVFALLLLHAGGRTTWVVRRIVVFACASCVVASLGWVAKTATGLDEPDQAETGKLLEKVKEPDDTLVSFGGRADIVLASGMESPYRFLWSLPMRTLDPNYTELIEVLEGPDAPTWLIAEVEFDAWENPAGAQLAEAVTSRYEPHGLGYDCEKQVFLRKGVERPPLDVDCRGE